MKRNIKRFTAPLATACAALTLAATSNAADSAGQFYVRADVGGTWTPDTELKEFFGPVSPGSEVEFDPGARFNATAGYQLTDWFAGEVQAGVMAANIKSITGASRVDAAFSNVPLLLNARFQWPSKCPFTPYVGGGAGLSLSTLSIERIRLDGTSVEGTDVAPVFGYQGFAGVRYRLNERMGLSLEYRYFATTEPSWEADNLNGEIRFGEIETHAISVAFDYSF